MAVYYSLQSSVNFGESAASQGSRFAKERSGLIAWQRFFSARSAVASDRMRQRRSNSLNLRMFGIAHMIYPERELQLVQGILL
jgi:hypothetical protein